MATESVGDNHWGWMEHRIAKLPNIYYRQVPCLSPPEFECHDLYY